MVDAPFKPTKVRTTIGQHLGVKSNPTNVLESILLIDLTTGERSTSGRVMAKEGYETVINWIDFRNRKRDNFLLLLQLFLVPAITKNMVELDYDCTDKFVNFHRCDFRYFRNLPTCYFNWKGYFNLKLRTLNTKAFFNYLVYLNFVNPDKFK